MPRYEIKLNGAVRPEQSKALPRGVSMRYQKTAKLCLHRAVLALFEAFFVLQLI